VSESDASEWRLSEWESHDAMMAGTDRFGDDFNRDAGTEGLEWETRIWHEL
jgi:hypothetical protein